MLLKLSTIISAFRELLLRLRLTIGEFGSTSISGTSKLFLFARRAGEPIPPPVSTLRFVWSLGSCPPFLVTKLLDGVPVTSLEFLLLSITSEALLNLEKADLTTGESQPVCPFTLLRETCWLFEPRD